MKSRTSRVVLALNMVIGCDLLLPRWPPWYLKFLTTHLFFVFGMLSEKFLVRKFKFRGKNYHICSIFKIYKVKMTNSYVGNLPTSDLGTCRPIVRVLSRHNRYLIFDFPLASSVALFQVLLIFIGPYFFHLVEPCSVTRIYESPRHVLLMACRTLI